MHVTVGIEWWGFPFIGLVAATLGSFLVHKYLAHRIKSIVLLWQFVGAVSVVCGILFWLITALIDHWSGAVPISFENLRVSAVLWSFLTVFAYVAVCSFCY